MPDTLRIAIIGGTGLGASIASDFGDAATRHDLDTPFGKPSDAILETTPGEVPIFLLNRHGAGHRFNPGNVPYRANIFALKQLGVTHIIASNAVGSLREEFKPRDLVIPEQIIDKTIARERTFYERAAVHVEFSEPFCPVLRQILLDASEQPASSFTVHARGCVVAMEGPAFSTRSESLMHRLWGGDLIGMTVMPEAKLAREAEISYASVALITDYDSWRAKPVDAKPQADIALLLEEIRANLEAATGNALSLIRRAIELMTAGDRREALMNSPARASLKHAIWSDRSAISQDEVQRLAPLWMKYFESSQES